MSFSRLLLHWRFEPTLNVQNQPCSLAGFFTDRISRSFGMLSKKTPDILGLPTVSDRIAQQVVKSRLEPAVDPLFHPDSYGYRPGKSALDAVGQARQRCWRYDWILDLWCR